MYKFIQVYDSDVVDDTQLRMDDILQLDETRRDASAQNAKLQAQMKYLYDRKASERKFQLEEMVLLWNTRFEDKGKHGKFDPIWLGPYFIHENKGEDSYYIRELPRDILELSYHGYSLKRNFH